MILAACFSNSSTSTSYTVSNGIVYSIIDNNYCTINNGTITFIKDCNIVINLLMRAEWENYGNYTKRGATARILLNDTSILSGAGGGSGTSATLPMTKYSTAATAIVANDILKVQSVAIKGHYRSKDDYPDVISSSYYPYYKAYPTVIITLV